MKTVPILLNTVCGALVLVLAGCSGKADVAAPAGGASAAAAPSAGAAAAPSAGASSATPPVTITTVKAQSKDFPVVLKATGTVTPITSVDVKAQVTSVVAKVHIQEGQFVKAGELMFTLDSRTDEANLAKARAQLAKDNASLADAKRQFARSQELFRQSFISQGALDTAQAQVDALAATVAADQAAIDAAKVALSFDRIAAPNTGRAGQVPVSTGSVVQANVTTLVTITQLDPISVGFSLPQRNLPNALAALKGGGAPVTATLGDGGGSFTGRLQFVDNAVDASSGSVKAKAEFVNKEGKLWPGAFVEVSQTFNTLKGAVVVPQAAIIQSARGNIVYTVEEGKAVSKPIQLVYAQGTDAAVTGVNAGDAIVVDGKQNVRPGSRVVERAHDAKPAASSPAASDAASSVAKSASADSANTPRPAAP